jgi:hypothetical protein
VIPAGSDEGTKLSTLIDLGGGGASIANAELQMNVGDRLSLSMMPAGSSRINLMGEVLRVSKGGAVAHVKFDNMSESYRDRIVGLLFRPQKEKQRSGRSGNQSIGGRGEG